MKKPYLSVLLFLITISVHATTDPNPKNGICASYTASELSITPQDATQHWTFGLTVTDVGGYQPAAQPLVTTHDNAVQFDHDHHFKVEYINDEQGIRQNFIINKPAGALTVRLQVSNGWSAIYQSINGVQFKNKDQQLNYSDLKVLDAKGKQLPAHFTLQQDQVEIAVDDAQATYPVSVTVIAGDMTILNAQTLLRQNQAGARLGTTVAAAGDINRDGFSDILVGAPYYTNGQTQEGAVFVYYGSANGINPNQFTMLERNVANGHFGEVIAGSGDVNGDGYGDVLVGVPYNAGSWTSQDTGYAYLYYGSATGLNTTPEIIRSTRKGDRFGSSVAIIQDLFFDGTNDIMIGAPEGQGYVSVYFGNTRGIKYSLIQQLAISGTIGFGKKVATGGFVDQFRNLLAIVVADNAIYLYRPSGQTIDSAATTVIHAPANSVSFGSAILSGRDINSDIYRDLVVGDKDFGNHAGALYVYSSNSNGFYNTLATTITGSQDSALLGSQLTWNGFANVIASAPREDINGLTNSGRVYVYPSSPSGLTNTTMATIRSDRSWSDLGTSLANAGDIDGDGYTDIIIGAPSYTDTQADEGIAAIFMGSESDLILSRRASRDTPESTVTTKTTATIKTFPNPTSNNLALQFEGLNAGTNTYLQLLDINGAIVKTVQIGKVNKGNQTIDVSTLVPGTYIMIIHNGGNVIKEKIIKQ
ncbi:Por secretion system C-terminal sorting domain-containing protein [Chitinophaga sp. YR573]|uniref:T9SS type A sorting domain-containing protein n=1 Tax=Chitinophaga sp. YR573 TaxID=1881040 RepID=UPI0008D06F90|nr:T9SS type A sorting domain-containing protein [Chitinophaga sp. YR573]SEW45905.1 Por secretion system C-terminal sorting domain-containing protein [Chitinophaga sp. YR573]